MTKDKEQNNFRMGYTRQIDSEMSYEEIIMGEVERLRELYTRALLRTGVSKAEAEKQLTDKILLKLAKKTYPYLNCPLNHYAYHLALIENIEEINAVTREIIKRFVFIPFNLIKFLTESEQEEQKNNPKIFQQDPMFCFFNCHTGHTTECHFPYDCRKAKCSHYYKNGMDLEEQGLI